MKKHRQNKKELYSVLVYNTTQEVNIIILNDEPFNSLGWKLAFLWRQIGRELWLELRYDNKKA